METTEKPAAKKSSLLSRPISLKKTQYPEKRTLNLMMEHKTMASPSRAIPMFLLVMALIAVFCKFAVIDRLAAVNREEAVLAQLETQLAEAQTLLAQYENVQEEYARYSFSSMTEEERALVDRVIVLELVERQLMRRANVTGITMRGNMATITLDGVTLEEMSELRTKLEENEYVAGVYVYSAGTEPGDATDFVAVSLSILLHIPAEGGADNAQ